jgi:predicted cobalt transporter CbtA
VALSWTYLRRGLLAGLLAGVLAGIFAFVFAEPILDRAIALENAGEHHHEAVFDRGEQKAGLILATALYGSAVGALFGLLAAYFRRRSSLRSEWLRSLALSGAVFLGAVLLPFLKYPPNPPGVGADPATLAERTFAYLAIIVLGLLAVFAAWRFARRLEGVSPVVRELAAGGALVVLLVFLYLAMPDFGGVGTADEPVPAGLIWEFRLSSLGTQTVLWAAIGSIFGLLGELASRRQPL